MSTDVNYCLNEFIRLFNAAVDVVAPFKEVRVRKDSNPWMNATILSGIKERDRLLSRFRKDRNDVSLYSDYCKIRNRVQRDVKMAKENYFKRKVEQNRGNSGKLWSQLKSLGYSNKNGSASKIILEEDGDCVFEPAQVSNIFNQ